MNSLPSELLVYIFEFIGPSLNVKLVSRSWRKIGDEVFNPAKVKNPFSRVRSPEGILFLLRDKRVDPTKAFLYAIYNQSLEIIKVLYENLDERIKTDTCLEGAVMKGDSDIFKFLLSKFQPTKIIFVSSVFYNNPLILEILLKTEGKLPKRFLEQAIFWGHYENIKVLLSDSRIDPSANDNLAIKVAARFGRTEIFKLLLKDKRVDPTAGNNHALRYAQENQHNDIIELLKEK